jgi:hypothetical protein
VSRALLITGLDPESTLELLNRADAPVLSEILGRAMLRNVFIPLQITWILRDFSVHTVHSYAACSLKMTKPAAGRKGLWQTRFKNY